MRIRIKGGRVIDPVNRLDEVTDVFIEDGCIVAVANKCDGFRSDKVIDATDHWVIPGIVDLQARLREPGYEKKATIASEVEAAVASGITTLVCPPDTMPVIDTPAVVELISRRASQVNKAKVKCVGALTVSLRGKQISEMSALAQAGCVAMGNADQPVENTLLMRRAMEYASSFGLTVFLYPQDAWLTGKGCAHEGAVSTRLGLAGVPTIAETIAVARDLALIDNTGVRAHFVNLSCAESVRMIARAQYDGLPVTASVAIHQLHLTEMDINGFEVQCHVQPPLRTQRDREGLRHGLAEGTISAICSDHQPHDLDAKLGPFIETSPGISALETLLPLSMRLASELSLSPLQIVQQLTAGPARILGVDAGHLSKGAPADICIFHPESPGEFSRQSMRSAGKNTPFDRWLFQSAVKYTLVDGRVVYTAE